MILMLFLFLKIGRFELILIVFLFSLVIGMTSIIDNNLPFSPYFQLFFLLFQTIVFSTDSMNFYEFKKKEKERGY